MPKGKPSNHKFKKYFFPHQQSFPMKKGLFFAALKLFTTISSCFSHFYWYSY